MLQIYDDQHRRIAGIDDPDDLKIEKTLSSGDKQISFSYPKTGSEIENLRAEYYIRTKDDEYVLKEINTGENKNSYVAQLNIEELENRTASRTKGRTPVRLAVFIFVDLS